jgi:hypothetical protein
MVTLVGHGRDRLDPARRDAPPDDRQSTQACRVLGQDLQGADTVVIGQLLGQEGGEGGLQLGHGCWVFL